MPTPTKIKSQIPYLSVIVPIHNGGKYLPRAIRSVEAQHYPAFEFIFIDDGSTDRSATIINAYEGQKTIVSQSQHGVAHARNQGLKHAKGSLIAFIDVDDRWPKNKIDQQLDGLNSNEAVSDGGICMGLTQFTWQGELANNEPKPRFTHPDINALLGPFLGSTLFTRKAFETVGLFDEDLETGEDADWYIRAKEQRLPIHVLDSVGLIYSRHDQNMTRGKQANIDATNLRLLKRSLDRRRQAANGTVTPMPRLSPQSASKTSDA